MTSGEYLVDFFFMAPFSQMLEPPRFPGRFNNAMRYGMDYRDPGADHYEQQYRDRVIKQLHRRAAQFGFALHPQDPQTNG
jgi:hypothetical protein